MPTRRGGDCQKKGGNSIGKNMVKHGKTFFFSDGFTWWIGSFRGRWVKLNKENQSTTCHLHPCHPAAMSSSSSRAVYFYDLFLGEYQIWWIVCGMRIISIYIRIGIIYIYIYIITSLFLPFFQAFSETSQYNTATIWNWTVLVIRDGTPVSVDTTFAREM